MSHWWDQRLAASDAHTKNIRKALSCAMVCHDMREHEHLIELLNRICAPTHVRYD